MISPERNNDDDPIEINAEEPECIVASNENEPINCTLLRKSQTVAMLVHY